MQYEILSSMIATEKIETSVADVFYDDGIMHICFKKDSIVELEHIEEIIEVRRGLQQGERTLTLVDTGKLWRVEKDARQKAASSNMINQNIALAIIAKTLANRLIANFYMKVDKPNVPTKMFNNYEEAKAWLKSDPTKK